MSEVANSYNINGLIRPLPSMIVLNEPDSILAEQYRILYTRLVQIRKKRPLRVIGITSAIQGEGKTTVAFNLAITMARVFNVKTLLIEADIKKPSFSSILTVSNGAGLTDALAGSRTPASLLKFTFDRRLGIVSSGSITEKTTACFTPERLQKVVSKLVDQFEFIIMDAPPVLPLADLNILEEVMDGILFVVQADRTQKSFVSKALSLLPATKLLGLVLNNLKTTAPFSYYYSTPYFKQKG